MHPFRYIQKNKNNIENLYFFLLFLFLVFLDQLSKHIIKKIFFLSQSKDIIFIFDKPFLALTYVQNTGVSFGLFKNNNTFFLIISLIAFFFFAYKFFTLKKSNYEFKLPLTILLSGILGNLLDRILNGFVIDFIDFIDFKIWPVFNFADIYISFSVILILYLTLKTKKELF